MRAVARAESRDAAWEVSEGSCGMLWASSEIQGMDILERDGKQPYFLAFFGLDTWDKVRVLGVGHE